MTDKKEIIFAGRSNVGKSSLIRALTGKKILVGRKPGVTKRPMSFDYGDLKITDMPGFGYMAGKSKAQQEETKDLIVRYIEENSKEIALAILVIDAGSFTEIVDRWSGRGEIPVEIEMFDFFRELNIEGIVAVNKIDKIKKKDIDYNLDEICGRFGMLPPWRQWMQWVVPVSAKKNQVDELRRFINKKVHTPCISRCSSVTP